MKKTALKNPIVTLGVCLLTITANAVAAEAQDNIHSGTGHLLVSAGYYDVFDDQDGLDLRAEYRPRNTLFFENLRPFAGLELTSEGSLWAGGGLLYDIPFGPNLKWHFEPSLGLGLYANGGSDLDLDYPVQFRSQLEISYEFKNKHRLGAAISHMSNAGLGDSNPGTEVFDLQWSVPLNKVFK